jgi:AraC family transcriptional activator of mtrCDE
MEAMTTALIKQILVTLFRRRLTTFDGGIETRDLLTDTQISHAFSEMIAQPGAPHTLRSLAKKAGLSRSVFMARFARALGQPPMAALRQLRMRYAATLLSGDSLSIEEVARAVGYASRSSFFRAFREIHGTDPSTFREAALQTRS